MKPKRYIVTTRGGDSTTVDINPLEWARRNDEGKDSLILMALAVEGFLKIVPENIWDDYIAESSTQPTG